MAGGGQEIEPRVYFRKCISRINYSFQGIAFPTRLRYNCKCILSFLTLISPFDRENFFGMFLENILRRLFISYWQGMILC